MWWWGLAQATATPGSTCVPGEIVGSRPADGAVVPPDVVVEAAFVGNCGFPGLELTDSQGAPVAAALEQQGDVLRLIPIEPLADGAYALSVSDGSGYAGEVRSSFVVEEGATLPRLTVPDRLEVSADRSCDGVFTTRVAAEASFPADPSGWAFVAFELVTENGVHPTREQLWYGQPSVSVTTDVLGGREVCVSATVSSADRAESELLDEVCADPFDACPAGPLRGEDGCSCTTAAPIVGFALPALFAMALSRRRRR